MRWLLKLATGNPLTLLWLAGAIAVASAGVAGTAAWKVQGWRLDAVRGEYAERDAKAQADATAAVQAAQTRARALEAKSATDVAAVSARYEQEKANAAKRNQKVIADLHTGALAFRVQLDTGRAAQGDRSTGAEVGASTGKCDGGPSSGLLAKTDAAFLVSEASRADEVVAQLTAAQAVIMKDREICR